MILGEDNIRRISACVYFSYSSSLVVFVIMEKAKAKLSKACFGVLCTRFLHLFINTKRKTNFEPNLFLCTVTYI